uniref:Lipocalin-like domain-containing protein n=1 Tax=Pinguiococcus pyrenoidosus TaxID=172671 RepID=A0A7R9UEL6_9STRA|mmetsp:Transcript_6781/g.26205  ORF Transcript_6781/g.26205 Transcript_6781/m.26205 type:complete len:147 (+) Transcript_6781:207-647(+)
MASGFVEDAQLPRHVSGLWIGEAVPDASLAQEIPVNPIRWAASFTRPDVFGATAPSFFGAGYFDDAGDLENSPLLFYVLQGVWNPADGSVRFTKSYSAGELQGLVLDYNGTLALDTEDGQPIISGSWVNSSGGSFGTFAARLEEAS